MNQRTISRFKLYPYGWLSPIPFEKNQPTVRCLRQRSFLANCMSPHASQSSPHIRPTCQCAPRSCHFCLNYWWTRKLAWVLVVGSFSSSFTGKKKTWRNLKLVTRWISNIYYNIITWMWKDISSNVGLLQVGSNPTFVPPKPGSPRFFCSHLLEPLSTEPLPLFLGSFLKQSRAVHMFSQIEQCLH